MNSRVTRKDAFIAFRADASLALAIEEIAETLNISQSQLIRLTMSELAQRLEVLPPVEEASGAQRTKSFEESYSWPHKRE